MSLRIAVTQALEALEVGNVELAVAVLDSGLEASYEPPVRIRAHCRQCGQGFEWAGLHDAHFCSRAAA